MQKSPNVAALAVTVKATHHQRGAGCSTTPEMRSVSQLKLRRFRTSGMRAISRSASFVISGAVGAASMINRGLWSADCELQKISRWFLLKACNADVFRVRHFWIRITNAREITDSWDDVQIVEDSVIAVLLFHF